MNGFKPKVMLKSGTRSPQPVSRLYERLYKDKEKYDKDI
jgi:hypothetical protein